MFQRITYIIFYCLLSIGIQAQDFQTIPITLNKGEQYQVQYLNHTTKKQGRKVIRRDYVVFHLQTQTDKDSVLKSTFSQEPQVKEISIEESRYINEGFLQEMLLMMHIGDSATFLIDEQMLFDALKKTRPKFIKYGSQLKYIIKILKVQTAEQADNDKKEIIFQQRKAEEKLITQVVAKNKIPAKRTYSGIYYYLENEGEGDFAKKDDVVSVRYTGRFLDGKVFGSSDDDGRMFEFPVACGFAIKGFDEVLLLMKKGAKGVFIMPSYLCYGTEGWTGWIPPDAPLIFEIEFIDVIIKKLIIEKKGDVMAEERKKEKKKEKSEEERLKEMEKDVRKKTINVGGNR